MSEEGPRETGENLARFARLHFIGVGGSGMSGLASLCRARGLQVTGSDVARSAVTDRLQAEGVRVSVGHAAVHVAGAECVVVSSAIRDDNPELQEARRRGLRVVRRAELLGWLMAGRLGVGVAGSHGKTTSTALLGDMAVAAGWDPTVVVGGEVVTLGGNVRVGRGEHVIAEADESDGSFLLLPCRAVLVTAIDDDHLDHHGTVENLTRAFVDFINGVGPEGHAVLCRDDPRLASVLDRVKVPRATYGLGEGADYRAVDVRVRGFTTTFSVRLPGGEVLGPLTLAVPGVHYAQNAAGCVGLCHRLGASSAAMAAGVAAYRGVGRRFERVGERCGVTVVDDYAHHPTKVRAVLAAARQAAPGSRILAVFQPHRLSRTASLAEAFGGAFGDADQVFLLPVYRPAAEPDRTGVTSALIYEHLVEHHPSVVQVPCGEDLAGAVPLVAALLRPGDWVLTVGAGSVTRFGSLLLEHLERFPLSLS